MFFFTYIPNANKILNIYVCGHNDEKEVCSNITITDKLGIRFLLQFKIVFYCQRSTYVVLLYQTTHVNKNDIQHIITNLIWMYLVYVTLQIWYLKQFQYNLIHSPSISWRIKCRSKVKRTRNSYQIKLVQWLDTHMIYKLRQWLDTHMIYKLRQWLDTHMIYKLRQWMDISMIFRFTVI